MIPKKTNILLLILCLTFIQKSLAQEVKVIDHKGTIKTINNNQVTSSASIPTDPLIGDVWFDTNNIITKTWNGTNWLPISLSKPIINTTGDLTLTTDHHTIILEGNHTITLPSPSTTKGKIYVIKNPNAFATTISAYINSEGTSNIQTVNSRSTLRLQSDGANWHQINGEQQVYVSVKNITANYTLVNDDNGKVFTVNSNSEVTLTIPSGLAIGFNISVYQTGTGKVTFTAGSGATLKNRLSRFKTAGLDAGVGIIATGTNIFHLTGDLTN